MAGQILGQTRYSAKLAYEFLIIGDTIAEVAPNAYDRILLRGLLGR